MENNLFFFFLKCQSGLFWPLVHYLCLGYNKIQYKSMNLLQIYKFSSIEIRSRLFIVYNRFYMFEHLDVTVLYLCKHQFQLHRFCVVCFWFRFNTVLSPHWNVIMVNKYERLIENTNIIFCAIDWVFEKERRENERHNILCWW